jgi:oligosaccharide repeat unit polymerase
MLSLFILYWLISIVLAKMQVYGLFEIKSYTYFLIGMGVVSFSIGFLIPLRRRKSNIQITREDISGQVISIVDSIAYKVILVIAFIYVGSLLVVFFDQLDYLGSMSELRDIYYEGGLYGPLFGQLDAFVLHPLYLVALPLFSYMLLYKRNWVCLLTGLFLFMYESIGGGRIGYIRIMLGVVFITYCLLKTFQNQKWKGYTLAIVGFLLVFSLISVVSGARSGDGDSREGIQTASKHLITYTAGPIVAFDYSVNKEYSNLLGGYQNGNLTLTPVISAINLFTSRLGKTFNVSIRDLVDIKQNSRIAISPQITSWNALYTANLFFYNDFGALGVIIFPFLFGIIVSSLVSKMYKYKSLPLIMVVSCCFWYMMDSVLDYVFRNPYDFLALIILYFWGTQKKYLTM